MIHTYRDPNVRRPKIGGVVVVILLFALLPLLVTLVGGRPVDWSDFQPAPFLIGAALLLYWHVRRHDRDVKCVEVRLDDDGICELETVDHVTRIHVSEIRAVEYRRDSENGAETYVIRYRDGKGELSGHTTEFADFLQRLKMLNPAVDLSSFPAAVTETLPEGVAPEPRSLLETFLRSALFPLVVIVLVVYVASQTVIK